MNKNKSIVDQIEEAMAEAKAQGKKGIAIPVSESELKEAIEAIGESNRLQVPSFIMDFARPLDSGKFPPELAFKLLKSRHNEESEPKSKGEEEIIKAIAGSIEFIQSLRKNIEKELFPGSQEEPAKSKLTKLESLAQMNEELVPELEQLAMMNPENELMWKTIQVLKSNSMYFNKMKELNC